MKILSFLFILMSLTFNACFVKKKSEVKTENTSKNQSSNNVKTLKLIATKGQFEKTSDPILEIHNIEIKGNTMLIDLSYSGGCETHDFKIIGSEAIAKSSPPIRGLQLVHNANGDSCRSVEKIRLEVNLEEVSYKKQAGSEIFYTIDGWNERIYHKYVEK